jgi:replicative DNA helicase
MKVTEAIELKFRNLDLEYQLASYISLKSPNIAVFLSPQWFSVTLLGHIVGVVKESRTLFTSIDSAIHELKIAKYIKSKDSADPHRIILKKLFTMDLSKLNDKSVMVLTRQLYELAESRRCLLGLQGIVRNIKDFDLKKAKSTMKDLSRSIEIHAERLSGEYLEDYEKRVEMVQEKLSSPEEGKTISIPTGFDRFDHIIGGVMPGEFGVVVGRPGIGKTAALLSFATHAWLLGKSVLFCSGEMSKDLIEFRLDSSLAGIPSKRFRTGELESTDWKLWESVIKKFRLTQQSFLEVSTFTRHFTTSEIESEIVRTQDKWGKRIDLICIDYINIMDPVSNKNGDSQKSWGNQADVVWEIKALAGEINGGIGLWSAGQIVDDAFDKETLELNDVKYARAISETAPIVVGLVQTQDDILENRIQFQVLKMRNAPRLEQSLFLHPNLDIMRIHDTMVTKRDLMSLNDDVVPEKVKKDKSYSRYKKRLDG